MFANLSDFILQTIKHFQFTKRYFKQHLCDFPTHLLNSYQKAKRLQLFLSVCNIFRIVKKYCQMSDF